MILDSAGHLTGSRHSCYCLSASLQHLQEDMSACDLLSHKPHILVVFTVYACSR